MELCPSPIMVVQIMSPSCAQMTVVSYSFQSYSQTPYTFNIFSDDLLGRSDRLADALP
jgi:hypothetical protein